MNKLSDEFRKKRAGNMPSTTIGIKYTFQAVLFLQKHFSQAKDYQYLLLSDLLSVYFCVLFY